MLNFASEHDLEGLTGEDLTRTLCVVNAAYIVAARKGAIRSIPEREQIKAVRNG